MSQQTVEDETCSEQSPDSVLTLASLTIMVLIYALIPFSRGTRWLGESDVAIALAEALKSSAESESGS